jgi:hypothetical protein
MKKLLFGIRRFFTRNYDAIKIGMLVGLLVTNFIMLDKQSQTIKELLTVGEQLQTQVEADSAAREVAREEADERSSVILGYLKCIVLLKPNERNEVTVDNCLQSATEPVTSTQASEQSVTTAPTPQSTTSATKEPVTTSEPPEPQEQPTIVDNLLESVSNLVDRLGL